MVWSVSVVVWMRQWFKSLGLVMMMNGHFFRSWPKLGIFEFGHNLSFRSFCRRFWPDPPFAFRRWPWLILVTASSSTHVTILVCSCRKSRQSLMSYRQTPCGVASKVSSFHLRNSELTHACGVGGVTRKSRSCTYGRLFSNSSLLFQHLLFNC